MAQPTTLNKIVWDELIQAKSWEQYISEYTGHKMDWRKWFNIAAIILSMIGGASWAVWKVFDKEWIDYITPFLFLLTGISQLASAIQGKVVVDENTLESLSRLRAQYIEYYNKLENLYLDVMDKKRSENEMRSDFFQIRESVYPIEELKDSLNIKKIKKVNNKVEKDMTLYLKARWG